jgi:hypothetical protein
LTIIHCQYSYFYSIGDHQSLISVGNDVQKGANQINMNKLDKRLPKNATDKIW